MGFLHNLSKDEKRAAVEALGQEQLDKMAENYFRGSNVRGAKSVEEALERTDANFEVGLRPLVAVIDKGDPDNDVPPTMAEVPGKFSTVRLGNTNWPLGVVGENYTTLQNGMAFGCMQTMIEQGSFEIMSCWQSGGGRRVGMEGLIGTTEVGRLESGEPDTIAHALSIETSHDGSRSRIASLFSIRLACDNGMTSYEMSGRTQLRHTSKVVDRMHEADGLLLDISHLAMEETALFRELKAKAMSKKQFANFAEDLLNAVRQTVTAKAPATKIDEEIEAWERKRERRDNEIAELVASFDRGKNEAGAEHGGKNSYGAYNVVTDDLTPRSTEERYADSARFARALVAEREGHGSRVRSTALQLLQRRR